jgi:hypothetical protein
MHIWTVLLICAWPAIGQVKGIGWPEAVARLTGERTKAENCGALLKGYGDKEQLARGRLIYGDAKADFDEVIAGLITALAQGGNPESLSSLEVKLGTWCITSIKIL